MQLDFKNTAIICFYYAGFKITYMNVGMWLLILFNNYLACAFLHKTFGSNFVAPFGILMARCNAFP